MDFLNDNPPSPTLVPKPLTFVKKKPASIAGPPTKDYADLETTRPRHESAPCYSTSHPSMQPKPLFHNENSASDPDVPVHYKGKNSRNLSLQLQERTIRNPASNRYEPVHDVSSIPSRIGELRPHYERRSAPARISGASTKRKPSPQEIRRSLLSETSNINPTPIAPLPSAVLSPPTPLEKPARNHPPTHDTQTIRSNINLKLPKFRVINGKAVRAVPPEPAPRLEHPSLSTRSVNETQGQSRPKPLDESLIHPALRSEFSSHGEIRYFAPRPHDADTNKAVGLEQASFQHDQKVTSKHSDTKHSVSFIAESMVPLHPAAHPSKTTSITVNEVSENESGHWTKRGFLPKKIPGLQQWIK